MPIWTVPAASDLRDAWDYIAEDNEPAADRIADMLVAAADRLDRLPKLGRPGPRPGLRQFYVPKTNYKLLYCIADTGAVEILRVYHTSREWPPE
ncbi:MAG TPA: type II toxin-antitoxin system RelE/ParE family toxin [Rhizomicrobium sp.]|jgi:plasmid stabilization system protein ParE|nr:type II toxin-antitoxin system RelE/ParE family toxin [Rhizomicrobium sp.]